MSQATAVIVNMPTDKILAIGAITPHIPDMLTGHWRDSAREPIKLKAGERYLD